MLATNLGIRLPSVEQKLSVDWRNPNGAEFWVKRDDLIHPIISGNKWRKLHGALCRAEQAGITEFVSFGGGYSNHLHALGYVCFQAGWHLNVIIRGDYRANPTPMLQDLHRWGAQIHYVTKATYQRRNDGDYVQHLRQQYPEAMIIPEGGSSPDALAGVAEIVNELTQSFDMLLLPVASGGTLAGLASNPKCPALRAIAVLKGENYLESLVSQLAPASATDWQILHDFHHGGYAKTSAELMDFVTDPQISPSIPLEPVYSGKLFFAARQLCEAGYFPVNSRILLLHTGGLQGQRK